MPIESVRDRAAKVSSLKNQAANSPTPADLISLIAQFNLFDDDIKKNKKYRAIMDLWRSCARTVADLETSLDIICTRCFLDDSFAAKLVLMLSSATINSEKVCGHQMRPLIENKIQHTLALGMSVPNVVYRKGVQIISALFQLARANNGDRLTYLTTPLLVYLNTLLDAAQPEDIELFTAILSENGAEIATHHPEHLTNLVNRAKEMLVSKNDFSDVCKLKLQFVIEIAANNFKPLQPEILSFYQRQMKF